MPNQQDTQSHDLSKSIQTRIDQYIYAVGRHLSPKVRLEIEADLKSHIWDAIEGHYESDTIPTLEQLDQVLIELGNPKSMAKNYNAEGPYLIGPALIDTYKLVVSIALLVSVVGIVIGTLLSPDFWTLENDFLKPIIQLFSQVFSTAISSFGMVTLLFAIVERHSDNSGLLSNNRRLTKSNWDPSSLPPLPNPTNHIKRSDAITDLITTGIGILFVTQYLPNLLHITLRGTTGQMITLPMLASNNIQTYIWMLGFILTCQLQLATFNLFYQKWHVITRLIDIALSLGFLVVLYYFFTDTTIVLPNVLNRLEFYRPDLADLFFKGTSTGLFSIFVVITFISAISIGSHIYNGFIKQNYKF